MRVGAREYGGPSVTVLGGVLECFLPVHCGGIGSSPVLGPLFLLPRAVFTEGHRVPLADRNQKVADLGGGSRNEREVSGKITF